MMRNRTSLPGIDIEDMVYSPIKGISYGAKFDWDEVWGGIVTCPKCGEDNPDLWSWGTDSRTIRDVPIGLAPVQIHLQSQRYKCKRCGGMFGTTHPMIKENSNMTIGLVHHIVLRAQGPEPHTHISRHTGVPEPTIRKYLHELFKPPRELVVPPLALGIDEFHAGTGKPCTVVTEIGRENQQVFEVLPRPTDDEEDRDRKKELEDYLSGLEAGVEPLPVVTDMSYTFIDAVRKSKTATKLIIDRFHLARQANRTLGTVHSKLGISGTLKETWDARKAEIDGENPEDFGGRQLHVESETKLELMEAAYKATLWYNWILTADISREEATRRLTRWRRALPRRVRGYFEDTVLKKLDELWDEILNYYDYRYTNSYNEGINNVGKRLERIGVGYSNQTIRLKLLYSQAPPPMVLRQVQHSDADFPCARAHADEELPSPLMRGEQDHLAPRPE
jgi:transposase